MKQIPKYLSFSIMLLTLNLFTVYAPHAAEIGGYVGFSIGDADDDVLNESDSGYKIYGGFTSTENIGVEIAFVDLGEYSNGLLEQYGVAFDVVGYVPVGQNLDVFGKVGLFSWNVDVAGVNVNDGTDLTYGIGVNVGLANQLAVRAEWENFTDIAGGDVSLLSVGIAYQF